VILRHARNSAHLPTDTESRPGALVNQSRSIDQPVAPPKKQAVGAKPKAARATKTTKAPQRPFRSSRAASGAEKLVCRYCGSDDLAPSFKKRRDARCRACFKQRYTSAARSKKTGAAHYASSSDPEFPNAFRSALRKGGGRRRKAVYPVGDTEINNASGPGPISRYRSVQPDGFTPDLGQFCTGGNNLAGLSRPTARDGAGVPK
jgi:hypothetical protein